MTKLNEEINLKIEIEDPYVFETSLIDGERFKYSINENYIEVINDEKEIRLFY